MGFSVTYRNIRSGICMNIQYRLDKYQVSEKTNTLHFYIFLLSDFSSAAPEASPSHNVPPSDFFQPACLSFSSCTLLLHPPSSSPPSSKLHILVTHLAHGSWLRKWPLKLKSHFLRGSFSRLTSQSQAGTLSNFSHLVTNGSLFVCWLLSRAWLYWLLNSTPWYWVIFAKGWWWWQWWWWRWQRWWSRPPHSSASSFPSHRVLAPPTCFIFIFSVSVKCVFFEKPAFV